MAASFTEPQARLDEFDKTEWRDIARRLYPDLDDEAFEVMWAGFVQMKRRKSEH